MNRGGAPDQAVRSGQIVTLAMTLGVVLFAVVSQAVGGFALDLPVVVQWAVLGGAALLVPAHLVLTAVMTGHLRGTLSAAPADVDPEGRIAQFFLTMTIARGAVHEGFALFAVLVATAYPLCLIGVGVAVGLLLAGMPTQARLSAFGEAVTRG